MAEDALTFRILRLAKPALGVQQPLKFLMDEDMASDSVRGTTNSNASTKDYKEPFADRAELQTAIDACGITGLMVLSKSFGEAYLGEVELLTARQKIVLYDNSTAPLPFLAPGSRHDFIIQHDIKDLGVHSLVCSTVYTAADGERRYTPETFKFTSANPLYVKTKTRQVGGDTLMEACIENYSKGPMVLEYVRFDAVPPLTAVSIDIRDVLMTDFTSDDPLGSYIDQLQVLDVGCGSNYLFRLSRRGGAASSDSASTALGKLEIKWRGSLGEVGRLQTQQILGPPTAVKEVELKIISIADRIQLERPFQAVFKLSSKVDRQLGPLTLAMASGSAVATNEGLPALDRGMLRANALPGATADSGSQSTSATEGAGSNIVACGVTTHIIEMLAPHSSTKVTVSLLPLSQGVQQLKGLILQGSNDGRIYDTLQPVEVLVGA